MSLNVEKNTDIEALQWWNYDLNREDILHDAENIKELQKNRLFNRCLDEILTEELADEEASMDENEDATYFNPIKVPKESKLRPVQLSNVNYTIHDTYSGKKIGIKDKITPSYYFDPASRSYKQPQVALDLRTFLGENPIFNNSIDLTKYGFTDTTITIKLEQIGRWNYMVVYVKTPDDQFQIKITPNKGEYDPENPKFPYLGGNEDKAKFFRTNANDDQNGDLVKHGKRFILCKLLGDLLHAAFASDGDAVFTNDGYLRDRCIKNKVDVIHREYCKKGDINCKEEFLMTKTQKGGVAQKNKAKVVKSSKKSDMKKQPKNFNQVSIYYYYPVLDGAQQGGSKQKGGNKSLVFQNESNKQNLLNHIDNYISKMNDFITVSSFKMYGNDVACPENVKTYIQKLIAYLSGDCKSKIAGLDTTMQIDEFNKELTKWFPQDILFFSEDTATEIRPVTTQYFSPTSIKMVFPYNQEVPYDLNYFTSDKLSFANFVASEVENPEMSPYTLNDVVSYFDQKLNAIEQPDTSDVYLLGHEELDEAIELISRLKTKSDLQNNDDFLVLMNLLIDSSFTSEDELLKAFLMVICGNDEIKAHTMYTSLLPLTYFNGFNIYDYQILSEFVKTLDDNVSLPGGYEAFMKLVGGIEVPETVFTMKTGMDITETGKIDQSMRRLGMVAGKKQRRSRKKGGSKPKSTLTDKLKTYKEGDTFTHDGKKYTLGKNKHYTTRPLTTLADKLKAHEEGDSFEHDGKKYTLGPNKHMKIQVVGGKKTRRKKSTRRTRRKTSKK
jgi:hypothetical protein|uniref:Uncharacterized protein n=1 Tax=viral metagenome TaxID=1070528 RepID=A0A6C0IVT9_9ZZZZ